MARARNIKPGLYKNEDLAECSIWARYLFPGLWTLADREGRLEDRPKRIKAELLPFDGENVDKLLNELHERGFLVRYKNADGSFIQISKFSTHQSPHYSEKPSVIKPPSLPENLPHIHDEIPREAPEHSGSDPGLMRGSQPPDSLIPDSRLSDSPNPDVRERASAQKRAARPPKTPMPENFTVSERVSEWAKSKGFDLLNEHLEAFASKVRQHGYRYVDWDEALMCAIREDWAGLRGGKRNGVHVAATKPWYADSWPAIVAKGAEKGLREEDYPTSPDFRAAVFKAHGITVEQVQRAQRDA